MVTSNLSKNTIIKKFLNGNLTFRQAQSKLGKSRATIYRYARMAHAGKEIIDHRRFGNNRKYGKINEYGKNNH